MNKKNKKKPQLRAPNWLRTFFKYLELLSPFIASRLASFLFFTPIRFSTPPQEKSYAEDAVQTTLKYKNNKVIVYEWGTSSKTILLVHGWSGRATQVAHLTKPLLETGYKVISFDAPAHGQSNGRHSHFLEFAEIILQIKSLHPEIEAVVGHSMGGTAVAHAIKLGLSVNKAVVIGAPAKTSWVLNSYCKQINVSTKVEKLIKQHIETKFAIKFDALGLETIAKAINIPGLIIHCKDDVDTNVNDAYLIHSNWKNSTLAITKNLGHRRILKDPSIARKIINFLNE